MTTASPPSALVTGASSGIGRATAVALRGAGYRVVGTCRDPEKITDPVDGVHYVALELGDLASVEAAAAATLAHLGDGETAGNDGETASDPGVNLTGGGTGTDRAGGGPALDLLVNNAGESWAGSFEETDAETLTHVFAVNVVGTVRLTQLLLPGMRARGRGHVVNVGSLLAEFPVGYRSAYVASKAALRGFTLAARQELGPLGIRMCLVEPAYYKTGVRVNRRIRRPAEGSSYAAGFAAVEKATAKGDDRAGDPADVAAVILAIARDQDPAPIHAVGRTEPYLLQARRLLSNRTVEKLMMRRYGLR
ncbi:SDR family NAD(P)-dependent oxidoreductase [Frankia sp. CNm7]|uniref:SDR family NAD(P)-dependent oxidoreductase n=1 Tax=Frankia nepalensis TaxID=1836974 RepID=A0A937RIS6_9ACTN|nr:SDR family NAD(P)-dependent oxidoreductase [Frankia nepalensis]MBL7495762.1 SDR family NAD(P)-dependent oxidoreductase [Frankia nepalensis]MBL7513005.1 SDR family NAD(P)-dependent oxidoreductase [Frankia nepalensis]MBL7523627.1 SDR family NAD(P)-dependent oxidoreductase [Frankia nepalensis]MBL7627128.1 SDR family NAD(P)-dependent oxidoreductase [Frankia nepalensis]